MTLVVSMSLALTLSPSSLHRHKPVFSSHEEKPKTNQFDPFFISVGIQLPLLSVRLALPCLFALTALAGGKGHGDSLRGRRRETEQPVVHSLDR
eukprot:m.479908 g.479908  ORF g.479908 m.479908 type:complete len:94 (-) comp21629_c0_seq1:368-649(-)